MDTTTSPYLSTANGTATAECEGTVLVRSETTNQVIAFERVLLLPSCSKKLLPVRPLLQKGCSIRLENYDSVIIETDKGEGIMHGQIEHDSLYRMAISPVHSAHLNQTPVSSSFEVRGSGKTAASEKSFFGLPYKGSLSSGSDQFARQLQEAHCSLGHLNFDTVRKMFGLKRGDNPHCPACALARLRKEELKVHQYERSTRPNHRWHLDIA